jgi:hypothetical protein
MSRHWQEYVRILVADNAVAPTPTVVRATVSQTIGRQRRGQRTATRKRIPAQRLDHLEAEIEAVAFGARIDRMPRRPLEGRPPLTSELDRWLDLLSHSGM